jgi:hypothetical protein
MNLVPVKLQRLSICSCGFPLLDERIGLDAQYVVDLDTVLDRGFAIKCGGCGLFHDDLRSVMASQTLHPERPFARLPYSVFEEIK